MTNPAIWFCTAAAAIIIAEGDARCAEIQARCDARCAAIWAEHDAKLAAIYAASAEIEQSRTESPLTLFVASAAFITVPLLAIAVIGAGQ